MYKTILCATDLSPRSIQAIKSGFAMARKFNSRLYILNSQPDLDTSAERLMSRVSVKKRMNESKELACAIKLRIIDIVNTLEVDNDYEFLLREGSPEKIIITVSNEVDADLIIMGTNGADEVSDYFLGTTTSNVIKSTDCPVLVIPIIK